MPPRYFLVTWIFWHTTWEGKSAVMNLMEIEQFLSEHKWSEFRQFGMVELIDTRDIIKESL